MSLYRPYAPAVVMETVVHRSFFTKKKIRTKFDK